MKEKPEPPSSKIAIPKAAATSTSTSESSVPLVKSSSPDLPSDLSGLVDSVFLSHKTQTTKTSTGSTRGSTKSTSTTTTIPDWQQWWNVINKDVDVSFIFNSGIKSIMNGAYRIASQRVYDTAVRRKSRDTKAAAVSTPTISNTQRRVNGMVHPDRRSGSQSRDMSHDFPQQNDYYRHEHNHYNPTATHPNRGMRNEHPKQSLNGDKREDDRHLYHPSRGSNDYHSKGWSQSDRRESHHNRDRHHNDRYNHSDDDSYSYSSRGRHYHRHHGGKRIDLPYPKEDHISAYENDHRSLASSISTKPQIGIPMRHNVAYADRHHYSREEYMERDRRRHEQQNRRRRNSSDSSTSDRTRNSDYSSRRRSRRRSHDAYERDHHRRYDDYERKHHRHRQDDHFSGDDDKDHGGRGRNRSESPSHRDDTSKGATNGRQILPSSTSYRHDRSSDSHSRSKDDSHARDNYKRLSDHVRSDRLVSLPEKMPGTSGVVEDRHSSRRSLDEGSNRGAERRLERAHDHSREEFDFRRERNFDEMRDRRHDKRGERSSNSDNEKPLRKYEKSERNDDCSATEAVTLPIVEVTTNGENEKVTKKRERRYSTPSPRKTRKSKHRKSSSYHKTDNNSDSDSSKSSNDSSPSNRRSRHHGTSSSRKHRRREYDGTDSEDNAMASSATRKRSSRKHRKKSRRNRSTKENETDDKGLAESDTSARRRSKLDKLQVPSIPEKLM